MRSKFAEFCKIRGKTLVDPEYLPHDYFRKVHAYDTEQFDWILEENARFHSSNLEINWGFVEDTIFNATAHTFDGNDYITINWGVVLFFDRLFGAVADNPSALPWLNSESDRRQFAGYMINCAKDFLFLHELGHIWNGHTSLVSQNGRGFIGELEAFSTEALGNLDLQTLEFDADRFAARLLRQIVGPLSEFPPSLVNNDFEELFGEGSTKFIAIAAGIYLTLRAFDRQAIISEAKTHPSEPIRQSLIFMRLFTEYTGHKLLAPEVASKLLMQAAEFSEAAFGLVRGQTPDITEFVSAYSDEAEAYLKSILRNWNVLQPKLDRLKRGGTIPPLETLWD